MASISAHIKSKNNSQAVNSMVNNSDNRQNRNRNRREDQRHEQRTTYFRDGFDHINLWSKGETPLGRALAMESENPINLPGLGRFSSVFALWVYLTTKNRQTFLRTAKDYVLRAWLRTRETTGNVTDYENVRYICAAALVNIVNRNTVLREALIATGDAQILSYIVHNNVRITHPQANWWVHVVTMARAMLIVNSELTIDDMSAFRDNDVLDKEIFVGIKDTDEAILGVFQSPPAKERTKKTKAENKEPRQKKVYTPEEMAEHHQKQLLAQAQNEQRMREELAYPSDLRVTTMWFDTPTARNIFMASLLNFRLNNPDDNAFIESLGISAQHHASNLIDGVESEIKLNVYMHNGVFFGMTTDDFENPFDEQDGEQQEAVTGEFADTTVDEQGEQGEQLVAEQAPGIEILEPCASTVIAVVDSDGICVNTEATSILADSSSSTSSSDD